MIFEALFKGVSTRFGRRIVENSSLFIHESSNSPMFTRTHCSTQKNITKANESERFI